MIDVVTLQGVVLLGVALPGGALLGVALLHPRKLVAPGGERDRTGQTDHHLDVTGDSRGRELGDRVELLGLAETLVTEDLRLEEMDVMVVMVHQDALRTVMLGGEVDQLVVPIGLHPVEVAVDVIVTLEDLEEADVIATLVTVVTMSDLERTDPEKDQPANLMTAGPRSSVKPSSYQTLF